MAINTGNYPKALTEGVKIWWGMETTPLAPIYPKIFSKVSSDGAFEEGVQIVGGGLAPQKPEGQATTYTTMNQGYTTRINNIAFSLGIIVTHEEIVDNKYPKIGKARIMGLKDSFRETRELNHAAVLNNAFTASYMGGDGAALCSLSHVTPKGGTQANMATVSAGLSEKSIEDMLILIGDAKDDTGFRQRLIGMSLVINTANQFRATRILKTRGENRSQSGTGNNDLNALVSMGMLPEGIIVNNYMSNVSNWFIKTSVRAGEGLVTQEREALDLFEDNEFDTRNYKTFGYERYGIGWYNWRCLFGSSAA
jgi:hypothetical protein